MAKREWPKIQDGELVQPRMSEYRMKCCDCGLVHVMKFKIVGRKIQFRAWRDERSTAASRREQKKRESKS